MFCQYRFWNYSYENDTEDSQNVLCNETLIEFIFQALFVSHKKNVKIYA